MPIDYTDIRLVGLEEEMTVVSPERPPLSWIFLRLSHTPIPLWQSYFKEVRAIARHPRWRRAWVDRRFIVVECPPEEIETHHLRDLKQDVAQVNERCRKYLESRAAGRLPEDPSAHEAQAKLRDIKGRLNFD
jgi:hypothetical protein